MTQLLHKALTGKIIGVYYDVYNGTSRTYPEFIYEKAMANDLRKIGIPCQRQDEYQVYYKDYLVGLQQLDLFVASDVVVEVKAAPKLLKIHKAQAISYLKVTQKTVGLLFNFGNHEPEFERLYFKEPTPVNPSPELPSDWPADLLTPELTFNIIGGLYEGHNKLGPGFIHRIYANAVYYELSLRGLEVIPRKEYQVIYRNEPIGGIKFNHIQVGNSLMVFPVAIQNINDLNIGNLKTWMAVQDINIGIVGNFYAASLEFQVLRNS